MDTAMQQVALKALSDKSQLPLIPSSLSCKESFAVSKIMGIWLVRKSSFNFRHITMHRYHRIMISLTIISGNTAPTLVPNLCSPLAAVPHFKIVRERFYNIITDVPIIFPLSAEYATASCTGCIFFFSSFSSEVFSVRAVCST